MCTVHSAAAVHPLTGTAHPTLPAFTSPSARFDPALCVCSIASTAALHRRSISTGIAPNTNKVLGNNQLARGWRERRKWCATTALASTWRGSSRPCGVCALGAEPLLLPPVQRRCERRIRTRLGRPGFHWWPAPGDREPSGRPTTGAAGDQSGPECQWSTPGHGPPLSWVSPLRGLLSSVHPPPLALSAAPTPPLVQPSSPPLLSAPHSLSPISSRFSACPSLFHHFL